MTPYTYSDDEARLVLPVIAAVRQRSRAFFPLMKAAEHFPNAKPDESLAVLAGWASAQGVDLEPQEGDLYWPTPREAKWIARLYRWMPESHTAADFYIARQYAAREARGTDTHDLDVRIAAMALTRKEKQDDPA